MTAPQFLARQIAWRMPLEAYGGLPEDARQLALAIAQEAPLCVRIESAAACGAADAADVTLSPSVNAVRPDAEGPRRLAAGELRGESGPAQYQKMKRS
jgi:hypothetical protein